MNSAGPDLATRLAAIIGAAHVSGAPQVCSTYSVEGLVPSAVAKPASAEQVAEIVRFAGSEKFALIPSGGRTKLAIGMPPTRFDLALDMTGLNQIAYYDPADLTLSVDAGMQLGHLRDSLAPHRQFVALDVPFFDQSTVGGAIASGIDSTLRGSYGSARDFLLGAEFVNGAGTLTKSGGRVVKNVTGYDLHKLLIGSLGTLAVITRLNFRIFPYPQGCGQVVAAFSTPEAVVKFQSVAGKSPLALSSLQILDAAAAERVTLGKGNAEPPSPAWFSPGRWHVFVSFEGTDALLRRYSSDLLGYAQESGASHASLLEESVGQTVNASLRELPNASASATSAATIFKIQTLPTFSPEVLSLQVLAERNSIPCHIFANVSGPLYFCVEPQALPGESVTALAEIAAEVFKFAQAHHGQASILFCPTELKRVLNVWGPARAEWELMRRVKQAFDPQSLFAPGRFVADM